MNYKSYKNTKISALGMGNMRLPVHADRPGQPIDYEKAQEIIDYGMANGINYYDTAYVYHSKTSEDFVGTALKKYPRDSFYVATKYFIDANPDYKACFEEQLNKLQVDHIDFYLVHCVLDGNYQKYMDSGCIEYFFEQKKAGRIINLGFSSHAGTDVLRKFASYADWDFAQIQLNYFDWNYSTAKEEYEILRERDLPVIVMEPVRGGRLAKLTDDAEAILKAAHPDWSTPSWALRFASSLPGVQVVLSGMGTKDMIKDNVATLSDETPFTDEDRKVLMQACELYKSRINVPCTACRYCCDGCPMQINIPAYLDVYNSYKVDGKGELKKLKDVKSEGTPKDCVACGACTGHCPQSIDIPTIMAELAELMD